MSSRFPALLALAIATSLGVVSLAHARAEAAPAIRATTLDDFRSQASRVRADMAANGRYAGLSETDRHTIEADLARIDALLQKRGTSSALRDGEQVDLLNAQEEVNALLTRNDGERLVCTLERRTGSKMMQKNCMTVADRNELRRKTNDAAQQMHQGSQLNWDGSSDSP